MIFYRHNPGEPLDRFVDFFWFYESLYPDHSREHVLPDGTFELVIDLQEEPRKLFDKVRQDQFTSFRGGWVSGTHSEYITIDALPGSSMIGVHFKPGGMGVFLGMPADELRDKVVQLESIWGKTTTDLREKLMETRGAAAKFKLLERYLLNRMVPQNSLSRNRVGWAVNRFLREPNGTAIRAVAADLGISHKHFISEFRQNVGITPKLFCRIQRFQQALAKINAQQMIEWADIAADCGYFDQAHFVNDFQMFSGMNPTAYLRHNSVEYPNFVPLDE